MTNLNFTVGKRLRYLFYLTLPSEESYEKLEDVPDYVSQVGPLFAVLVVLEMAILLYKKKLFINDSIASISQGIIQQSTKLGFGWLSIVGYIWVFENWRIATFPWNSAWVWWFCLISVDFFYYWVHRASHEINIFWAAHQVHHSSEQYNLSTALRQSILQHYITVVFYLPLALIVPPPIFVVHMELNLLYQFWIHTEFINKLGPLEYILNTPSHHRVHHGRNRYCIDKNYAGVLIIWDRLFGTFEPEGDRVVYGLTHPINTFNPISIQTCHIVHIWNTFWSTKGAANKLSVLIKGPGWEPGKPWHGNIEDIPDVSYPTEVYNPPLQNWCNIYASMHFMLLAFGYLLISDNYKSYNWIVTAVFLTYIVFSLTVLAVLMDNRPYAALLELSRCVIYLVLDYYFLPSDEQIFAIGLRIIFLLSSLMWTVINFQAILFKVHVKME